ncbi:MAG TPA: AAA family ATPase [Microlunatus sp.]|nr:AAA family ATPase [Microlunatus sp.]
MSSSEPPADDVPSNDLRSRHASFAWGEPPIRPGDAPELSGDVAGRWTELGRLDALLEAARAGSTTSLVLEGEPGMGKTTLLLAAARRAAGFRRLWARGSESESVLAHAGLLQALGPLREVLAEIPSVQAAALSVALGWEPPGAPTDRFLVAAAVLSLLAAEAERAPVIVLVDDLQWVDRESASALAFAARRLRDDPVCFVWAGRTGRIPAELVQALPVVPIPGLTRTEARILLRDRVADRVADRLVDDMGGNPLAMLEIASRLTDAQRIGAAPLPDATIVGDRLRHLYGDRLTELSAPARRAVLLTAINRSGSPATVVVALTREEIDVASALDEATDLGILVRSDGELVFRHPMLRTAAVSGSPAAEQRSAHRALASVLAAEPDSVAGTWHRAEAVVGPDQPLALDLVRSASRTRSRQGYAAASVAMERAAVLAEDPVRMADWLASAAADAFAAGDAARTRSLAARVLNAPGDDRASGLAQLTLGLLEEHAGSVPASVELLTSAVELLGGEHRTDALAELALAHFRLNDVAGVAGCATAIAAVVDRQDPRQRMLADFTLGFAATVTGDTATGGALLRGVVEQVAEPPLRDDPRSLVYLALAGGFLGDPGPVMALGTHQLDLARARGALGLLVPALSLSAAARAWLGDHAGAFADAGEAAELGEQLGYAADVAVALEMLAWQSAARGRHDEARVALERATVLTDRAGTTTFAAHQAITAAFCALCRADPTTAVSILEPRLAADGGVGSMGEPLGVAPDLIEAYLALGRREEAIALADGFAAATGSTALARQRALVARCRGLTAPDQPGADLAFQAALLAHAEAPDHFEAARTHLLYGVRLRRAGHRVRARAELVTALAAFTTMDLTAWVRRAAEELSATGATARSRRARTEESLTAQETRVALHAAQGMSTKEIAAVLFLSPRTVEHHLSSVYRKRGVRSRAELASSFRPPAESR